VNDDQAANEYPLQRLEDITFDGDTFPAIVRSGDGVAIPVRSICEALGLDVERQSSRLRDHEVLSQGLRVVRLPMSGQLRSVVAILHKYIPFWLATINPRYVKKDVRPKLVRYQIELVDVLAALYGAELQPVPTDVDASAVGTLKAQMVTTMRELRLIREALISTQQRTDEHLDLHDQQIQALEGLMDDLQQQMATHTTITSGQQELIKRAIQRLATRYKRRFNQDIYARLFTQFCVDLGTPKYSLLPAGKYTQALDWLRKKAAEILPDDPDALPALQETLL
jgi:hypothetical protein